MDDSFSKTGKQELISKITVGTVEQSHRCFYRMGSLSTGSILKIMWFVVSAIMFNKYGQGMALGQTSSLIAALQAPDSEMKINTEIASWLGTSIGIGNLISYPIGSYLMARFGRKIAYIAMNIPAIIGFILTAYAHTVVELLIGRVLYGICGGSTSLLAAMIIGEFTSPEHRGMFLILNTSFLNFGSLVVHLVSNYIEWRTLAAVNIVPFAAAIIITCLWPESPHWLAEQRKFKKSEQVFYWLRGKTQHSTKEIDEILENNQNKKVIKTLSHNYKNFLLKFKKKNFVKPFIIIIFASIMIECSGRHIIPAYSFLILRSMTSKEDNLFYYSLIVDTIIALSAFLSAYLIRIFKIRPLLFTTGAATVISLNLACLFLYFTSKGILPENYTWLPLCCFCVYVIMSNISCAPLPLTIVGEIFPQEHRAIAVTVYGYLLGASVTLTLKITPIMLEKFNTYGTFPIFAFGILVTLVAMYIMLPETKDQTLQEIDDFFTYGKKTQNIRIDDNDDEAVEEMIIKENSNC